MSDRPVLDAFPCHECAGPGVRNIGTRGYCGAHLSALYAKFDTAVQCVALPPDRSEQ